ncbi:MAG: HNH endonuclease [Hassallia sp.]
MSRPYISLELRRLVADRADYLCEYCLIPDTNGVSFQVDHIISLTLPAINRRGFLVQRNHLT